MWMRWLPWRWLVKRAARAYGMIDPVTLLARVRSFSQASEVQEPIELVRAGIMFQARGLINTRAIQFNLDWVWPYWVEKQFNPEDISFIPRAYSATHLNLTQRNWTAVGQPDLPLYPLVDPRGLVTPLFDGWSLDFWLFTRSGKTLYPSKLKTVEQSLEFEPNLMVVTRCREDGVNLTTWVELEFQDEQPVLRVRAEGRASEDGWLILALRPYNPEGIEFVEKITYNPDDMVVKVNGESEFHLGRSPEKVLFSNYEEGDVRFKRDQSPDRLKVECKVGMATMAAFFPIEPDRKEPIEISMPLKDELKREYPKALVKTNSWPTVLKDVARLKIPDERIKFLYEAAVRTLVLLSAYEAVPGPYNYRRFWFRDACLMINAMLTVGLADRCNRLLDTFPGQQKLSGYFQSQEGEWDSNGQVLWIMERFRRLTNRPPDRTWIEAVVKGAEWIQKKRVKKPDTLHYGLLPAGFSAEHFGPNDYYYWDDFWALAGLRAAARLSGEFHSIPKETEFLREAEDLERAILKSIETIPQSKSQGAIPASPYRRMDAGAVGVLVADYPLRITAPNDHRIKNTVDYLNRHYFVYGGFFQDMVHSGINVYLTLAIAQTMLRQGNDRYRELIASCAGLATPTGQWPEAVHPFSGGGCMGDGQHGWAAAEWVMMIRNLFVREEDDRLVIGEGIFPNWLETGEDLFFGPTLTPFGPISVDFHRQNGSWQLKMEADWYAGRPVVLVRVPGFQPITVDDFNRTYRLEKQV